MKYLEKVKWLEQFGVDKRYVKDSSGLSIQLGKNIFLSTCLHLLFTPGHFYPPLFMSVHSFSLLSTLVHLLFTPGHFYPPLFISVHSWSLLSTPVHLCPLLLTSIRLFSSFIHSYPPLLIYVHSWSPLF